MKSAAMDQNGNVNEGGALYTICGGHLNNVDKIKHLEHVV